MAGIFTTSLLAEGMLPDATTVLYTVPVDTSTIIKTITYVNRDPDDIQVNLYLRRAGEGLREIIPVNTSLGGFYLLETDRVYTLSAGDTIEGDAFVADTVAYTINGVQET